MSVPTAYLAVILVWSTTPLAIQASGHGSGALLGLTLRMAVGLGVLALVSLLLPRFRPQWRGPMLPYLASGLPLFVAMTAVYSAAQRIPSGWISVVFGTTPAITAVLAYRFLGEARLRPLELLGIGVSLAGLAVLALNAIAFSPSALTGIGLVGLSALTHAAGSVWIKRIDNPYHSIQTTIGGLALAVPLFAVGWFLHSSEPAAALAQINWAPILYLAVFGTALGFPLYFYLLRELAAARVALIALMTPALGVLLGAMFNNEPVNSRTLIACGLVITGLGIHQYGGALLIRVKQLGGSTL